MYAHAKGAVVLTTREGTQPSGATESISLEVPLIVSDIKTTRKLYEGYAIFVENEADSIALGMRQALAEYEDYHDRMRELKYAFKQEIGKQIESVKNMLAI